MGFTKVDDLIRADHRELTAEDHCLFLREYKAHGGFEGETNSLILNLKKKPSKHIAKLGWHFIAELEKAGFVQRIERRAPNGGKQANQYDLSGLVERLQKLEPEFREVEKRVKARRDAVSKPAHKMLLGAAS